MIHEKRRHRFPLSAFFLVILFFAILAIVMANVVRTEELMDVFWMSAISGANGLLLGAIIGLFHYRRLLGLLIGGFFGMGTLFVIPLLYAENFENILQIVLGGSVIIMVLAFLIHMSQVNASRRQALRDDKPKRHALDAD